MTLSTSAFASGHYWRTRQPLYDWDDNDYVDDYPKPMNDKYEGSYYPEGPHNFVYADSDNDSTKQEPA